jgi:ubiquinone biosynthesis protein UbiJ
MTGQDVRRGDLTPEEMAKLRAELQQQHGITPAQAEAAAILVGSVEARLVGMEAKLDRLVEDVAAVRETMDRMVARLVDMAERDRGPPA